MSTPVRNWIKDYLSKRIPVGTIWSDQDTDEKTPFKDLTGVTHETLMKKWYKFDDNGTLIPGSFGTDSTFTTCSSFLVGIANKIREAGKLPLTKRNYYSGKNDPIIFQSFHLERERGWTPAYLGYAANGGPKEGDFFQLASPSGMTLHVGIILNIEGDLWSKVAGGAGGRGGKRDGVKRTPLELKPGDLMGWLDVDSYFEGWNQSPGDIVKTGQAVGVSGGYY